MFVQVCTLRCTRTSQFLIISESFTKSHETFPSLCSSQNKNSSDYWFGGSPSLIHWSSCENWDYMSGGRSEVVEAAVSESFALGQWSVVQWSNSWGYESGWAYFFVPQVLRLAKSVCSRVRTTTWSTNLWSTNLRTVRQASVRVTLLSDPSFFTFKSRFPKYILNAHLME